MWYLFVMVIDINYIMENRFKLKKRKKKKFLYYLCWLLGDSVDILVLWEYNFEVIWGCVVEFIIIVRFVDKFIK